MANLLLTPKPTTYIDLDGMAVNLIKRLIEFHNEKHGKSVTFETAWDHYAEPGMPDEGRPIGDALDHFLARDRIFHDLEPIPGFAAALPELQDISDVVIASAPSRNPDSATDKMRWVLERFPAIHRKKIILIKEKWRLRGHAGEKLAWLEDWHTNISEIREADPHAFIGTIAYPYNEKVSHLLNMRAEGFHDTEAAWSKLVVGVREFFNRK